MSGNDPGGGSQDIANLQESLSKQQAKISALKELVRKSEAAHGKSTTSAQEKVKNIAQRLTHLKTKARYRQNLDRSLSELRDDPIFEESSMRAESFSSLPGQSTPHTIGRSETPGSEKVQLLRQQMEQNKLKMAERENSKREIEEMVTQLKARFDDTQASLERSSELGRSMGDLSVLAHTPLRDKIKSATDLSFTPLNLDKEKIKFLENRVKHLEKQLEREKDKHVELSPSEQSDKIKLLENKILDLEESLKEKESVIEARTQAVSLMSENLSLKSKTTVDTLEDTRQEMIKMQSSFIETEDTLRMEIQQLHDDVEDRNLRIKNLEEVNDILESARFDLTVKNAELENKIQNVQDYSTKLSELNKLNESLQHRIADLESQKYEFISPEEVDVTKQITAEYMSNVQSLQEKIKQLETENDDLKKLAQDSQHPVDMEPNDETIAAKIKSLEATIEAQREEIEKLQTSNQQIEEQLTERTIECNVLNANFSVLQEKLKASTPKSLFSKSTDEEAEIEINKLKAQLDEANKSMIKMKLKAKQLQKQVDGFKKISDTSAEVVRLNDENQQLQQRVAELEEEKGSLQLKLVSGESTEVNDTEMEKKIQVLETTCQNQTSAIQLLEEQKIDMTENLQTTRQQLAELKDHMQEIDREETARVSSHMKSVQVDEEIEDYLASIAELKAEIDRYRNESEYLRVELDKSEKERSELSKKVEHYVAENMELLDKIEKLSKSSSSAESIEIVEGLTQQEKLEIEAYNKKLEEEHSRNQAMTTSHHADVAEHSNAMGQELSDSLIKLREESSELQHRIELFTTERREVLEKMEVLHNENLDHLKRIHEITDEKLTIEDNCRVLQSEKSDLEQSLLVVVKEKEDLAEKLKEVEQNRNTITEEMNHLLQEKRALSKSPEKRPIVISANLEGVKIVEKSLERLNTELENYRKSDKNSKINTSKKLAKEAKNVHQQIEELLKKLREVAGQDCGEESLDVEVIRKQCKELEDIVIKLRVELSEKKQDIAAKDQEIMRLTTEVDALRSMGIDENKEWATESKLDDVREEEMQEKLETIKNYETKTKEMEAKIEHLEQLRKEVDTKLTTSEKEIEILKTLVAEQKQQLIEAYTEHETEIAAKMEEIKVYEQKIEALQVELVSVQSHKSEKQETYVKGLQTEIKKLENLLSGNQKLVTEMNQELKNKQDTIEMLNSQIMDLYKVMEENANKVVEKEDEVTHLQDLLDTNNVKLESLSCENEETKRIVERLQAQLAAQCIKVDMNVETNEELKKLEQKVKLLEGKNSDLESKNKEQLDKLKKFAANLKKKVAHCNELEEKLKHSETVEKATVQVDEEVVEKLKNKIEILKSSLVEMENLKIDLNGLNEENVSFKSEIQQKDNEIQKLTVDVNQLKQQLVVQSQEFMEMQEILESLRADAHQKEETINKLSSQVNNNLTEIQEKDEKLKSTGEELNAKSLKFEKCKALVKEKNREIQRLSTEKTNLTEQLKSQEDQIQINVPPAKSFEEEYRKLNDDYQQLSASYEAEKSNFQQTIARLEMVHDGIQAKLQEDMGYIETLETENNAFKEKIMKLETCVATLEDRRASLERQSNILDAQLHQNANDYEKNEDELIQRLNALSEHDDVIGKRLLESQDENDELTKKCEMLKVENADLQSKIGKLQNDFDAFKSDKVSTLETENQSLQERLNTTLAELSKIHASYESKLASKNSEIDELENDLSIQLQTVNTEKRNLTESLEKARDEISELKDEAVRLRENAHSLEQIKNDLEREMTWIKMQNENFSQDQLELQELRVQLEGRQHQMDSLIQNHEIELNALRTQIAELDSMRMQVGQNQTDDQVFIETENKKLKELLSEKDVAIESYQRQNLQLQMASAAAFGGNSMDPFIGLGGSASQGQQHVAPQESVEMLILREKVQKLENDLSELHNALVSKDEQLSKAVKEANDVKQEIRHVNANNSDLQKLCLERQSEVSNLRAELERIKNPSSETVPVPMFFAEQSLPTVFDEIAVSRHIEGVEGAVGSHHHQKKIEDLERNVSDLEKYATDLESKLKHLTVVQEDIMQQNQESVRHYEETIRACNERIRELEEKLQDLEAQKNVESMIVQSEAEVRAPSLNMFFDAGGGAVASNVSPFDNIVQPVSHPQASGGENLIPAVEEVIVPKKAYLCYPEENEGWGWSAEEATLEETYQQSSAPQQSTSLVSPTVTMEIKIQEYQDRIHDLEAERNKLEEKLTEVQTKSLKLVKKLKEYKAINDQLTHGAFKKSPSVESNDLDLAIQEELKSQVKNLEEKFIEARKLNEKTSAEKENLIKRVDVLTAANERMTEMKERQDNEVEMQQTKIRQLMQQLQQLQDWGDGNDHRTTVSTVTAVESNPTESTGVNANSKELHKKIQELNKEVEDLKVDRDELQALLDEEKSNVNLSDTKVKDLQNRITSLEMQHESEKKHSSNSTNLELQSLRSELANKETDLNNLKLKNQNLQLQLNDYQTTIEQLSTESTAITTQLGQLRDEHQRKLDENTSLVKELQSWIAKNDTLSREAEAMRSSQAGETTAENHELNHKVQELDAQLQYKDAEIMHWKQKVEQVIREDQTQSLVQEILGKNQDINSLKQLIQTLETDKIELENNLSLQLTKEMGQKSQFSDENVVLTEQMQSLQKLIDELKLENDELSKKLEAVSIQSVQLDAIRAAETEILVKDAEITKLKQSVEALKLQQHPDRNQAKYEESLKQIQEQWEVIVEQRCGEVAERWRQHLSERETEFQQVEQYLRQELESVKQQPQQLPSELSPQSVADKSTEAKTEATIPEQSDNLTPELIEKMQTALENQELEIVTLKEQLALRSAEYARLAAQHDPYGMLATSNSLTLPQRKTSGNSLETAAVSKSEYDLTLYMLHQRDMRCEELTLELLSLLEERDTLQLKLSNSIRQMEDIKRKTGYSESGSESDAGQSNTNSPEKATTRSTGTVSDEDYIKESDNLNAKLSQLHAISHSKDSRAWDESDGVQREREKIQEDVANIPSEAVSELVGTDLMNTTQSPSTVLLNWLWGKTANNQQQS